MILLRECINGENIETDISDTQTEICDDASILSFMGQSGLLKEVRMKMDIFTNSEKLEVMMSRDLADNTAEIYYYADSDENDKYIVVYRYADLATLYGVSSDDMSGCVEKTAKFLREYVSPDTSYLTVISPVDIGLMCLTFAWLKHADVEQDWDNISHEKFAYYFDTHRELASYLDKAVADLPDVYAWLDSLWTE